jgi:hypothetical protein
MELLLACVHHEMKMLQWQRLSAFDAESRGLPEAAWVFSRR